jgi:hypothetical protein
LPSSRSASIAKSIIMIAFFFTMPIRRMMPMIAITSRSLPREQEREQRADARRRQRRQDRDGMDVALVEHAEHDVHGDDRGEDQPDLVSSDERNAAAAPCSFTCADRHVDVALRRSIAFTASPSDAPCARLNEIVAAGNWPMSAHDQRARCARRRAQPSTAVSAGCSTRTPARRYPRVAPLPLRRSGSVRRVT